MQIPAMRIEVRYHEGEGMPKLYMAGDKKMLCSFLPNGMLLVLRDGDPLEFTPINHRVRDVIVTEPKESDIVVPETKVVIP